MARPSSTADTMVEKLSSARTISEADLATAVPLPMAIPISAFFKAGASLTPSPVYSRARRWVSYLHHKLHDFTQDGMLTIAETSPSACRNSTILLLCAGSTRAKRRERRTASRCSSMGKSSNSRPVKDLPVVGSSSEKTPMRRQMASAVALLSPVITMTRMPA